MCIWTCNVQGNTVYSDVHVDDPLNPIHSLFYEICWYIVRLLMETWIHLVPFPLLEVDVDHCACGPLSCFKLPVVALLQWRSSFPFLLVSLVSDACLLFDDIALLGAWNIHHFVHLFNSFCFLFWLLDQTDMLFIFFVDQFFFCTSENVFCPLQIFITTEIILATLGISPYMEQKIPHQFSTNDDL